MTLSPQRRSPGGAAGGENDSFAALRMTLHAEMPLRAHVAPQGTQGDDVVPAAGKSARQR